MKTFVNQNGQLEIHPPLVVLGEQVGSIIRIETICGPPQLFEIYAVVRFTPLRGHRTPGGADRGVPSTEMD